MMKHLQKLIIAVPGFLIRGKNVDVLFHGDTESHHVLNEGPEQRHAKASLKLLCQEARGFVDTL